MDVFITDWSLNTYLELKHKRAFTDLEYRSLLRPDAEKLKYYPHDQKFQHNVGWGPAQEKGGVNLRHGFKLKWHNIGSGKVQLRVAVAIVGSMAFLCRGYVKSSDAVDKREIARLKKHINRICLGRINLKGKL